MGKRGDGSGHKGGQARARDREQEEEGLLCPGGRGAPGATLPQPACVLQGVAARRDGCGQAGGGEAGQGGFGDAGGGEDGKEEWSQAAVEAAGASSVGRSARPRHPSTLPSEWMAYYLAQKLGVNSSATVGTEPAGI